MPYISNMISTGCLFISIAFTLFPKTDLWILGNGKSHFLRGHSVTPLFEHLGASSWHSWDAALILFIGAHRVLVLGVLLAATLGVTLCLRWGLRLRKAARRKGGRDVVKE